MNPNDEDVSGEDFGAAMAGVTLALDSDMESSDGDESSDDAKPSDDDASSSSSEEVLAKKRKIILGAKLDRQRQQKGEVAAARRAKKGENPDAVKYRNFTDTHKAGLLEIVGQARKQMRAYADEHELDPLVLGRVFDSALKVTRHTPWQAFQRLRGLERDHSKYSVVQLLSS